MIYLKAEKEVPQMKKDKIVSYSILIVGILCLGLGIFLTVNSQRNTLDKEEGSTNPPIEEVDDKEENEQASGTMDPTEEVSTPSPVPPSNPTPSNSPQPSKSPVPSTSPTPSIEETSDAQVIAYFEQEDAYIETVKNSKDTSIMNRLKSGFITIVDFLFYEKPIKGYTFKQLTETAKLKVVKLALTIDAKIDQYFPGYKDQIKKGYDNIKSKLVTLYLNVTSTVCEKVGSTTCNQAKEDFQNMKDSFGLTFDFLKDIGSSITGSIKDWYESFREKNS